MQNSKGLTGNISPRLLCNGRNGYRKRRPKRDRESYQQRRKVLEGYPLKRQLTYEEVQEYFSKDKITCLLCGKTFGCLALHLKNIHGTTTEKYKMEFGLPLSRGLTGKHCHDMKVAIQSEHIQSGRVKLNRELAHKHAWESLRAGKIRESEYRRKSTRRNGLQKGEKKGTRKS